MTTSPASRLAVIASTLLLLTALPTMSRTAHALFEIGVEVDLAIPVGDTSDVVDLGWGVEGRVGIGLPIPAVDIVLEAIFDFAKFPITDADASADAIRVAGGARIGVPVPFVPSLFAHVGFGDLALEFGDVDLSDTALTWDVGIASDLFSVPLLSLGVHVAYKQIAVDQSFNWIGVGLHGVFGF